jgi:hypothetical protein
LLRGLRTQTIVAAGRVQMARVDGQADSF